jgi:hypothetical protein
MKFTNPNFSNVGQARNERKNIIAITRMIVEYAAAVAMP